MKAIRFFVALICAVGAHLLLVRLLPEAGAAVSFLSIVLVLFAQGSPVLLAALMGAGIGWITDGLASSSLYGLHGIAATLAAAICARVAQQVSFTQPALLAAVFAIAVVFQEVVVAGLMRVLFPDPPAPDPAWVLVSAIATAFVGGVIVVAMRRFDQRWRRYRRLRRPKVRLSGSHRT